MKTKITTLILLLLGLSSGKTFAQTHYHYTDAEGLTWTFVLDGAGGAILDREFALPGVDCVSGSLITVEAGPYAGSMRRIYNGDVLRIPSIVNVGSNTYPVRAISSFAFNAYFTAEKVILPASLTEPLSESFFHTSLRFRYSEMNIREKSKKIVSIIATSSYDTFLLYPSQISEYARRGQKLPKCSKKATIRLHIFKAK